MLLSIVQFVEQDFSILLMLGALDFCLAFDKAESVLPSHVSHRWGMPFGISRTSKQSEAGELCGPEDFNRLFRGPSLLSGPRYPSSTLLPFLFGVSLVKQNSRKKGTLIV